jgi:hypothetical protein
MTIQPIPALRFNASQKPWQVTYSINTSTTGVQDILVFTAAQDTAYELNSWVWWYASGTATDKSNIFKKMSGTNYMFWSFTTLAANYPHSWSGRVWFEYPDTIYFRINVSVQPLAGNLYLTGLQYLMGEGGYD